MSRRKSVYSRSVNHIALPLYEAPSRAKSGLPRARYRSKSASKPATNNPAGPPLQVLVGTDGTEVIHPGETGDNTGVGTWHLARCTVAPDSDTGPGTGNTGNTGVG